MWFFEEVNDERLFKLTTQLTKSLVCPQIGFIQKYVLSLFNEEWVAFSFIVSTHYNPDLWSLFPGKTTKGRGGQKTEDPALCLRPQKHRLPFQREAARRHDEEAHQDHQGGTRKAQGQSGGKFEDITFLSGIVKGSYNCLHYSWFYIIKVVEISPYNPWF